MLRALRVDSVEMIVHGHYASRQQLPILAHASEAMLRQWDMVAPAKPPPSQFVHRLPSILLYTTYFFEQLRSYTTLNEFSTISMHHDPSTWDFMIQPCCEEALHRTTSLAG